jgi:hypothetical protein
MSQDNIVLDVEIGDSVMYDLEYMEEFDALATQHGFSEDTDYKWYIAIGDDMPNALVLFNEKMLEITEIKQLAVKHEGVSCYNEDDDEYEDDEE